MNDIITAVLLLVGAAVMLLAAIGILRMPDLFTRMHAATKLPTLGMSLVFIAVAVHFSQIGITTRALLGLRRMGR
jgi:multicomponent Na+:H+ antiporter subunit G